MIVERLAGRMAAEIKRQVPDHKSSIPVLKHAIIILINVGLIVIFTLLISFITDNQKQAIIALIGFALLRQCSGGLHLKTGAGCIVFTTALFTLVSYVEMESTGVFLMNAISLLLVMNFAPSRIEKQSRIPRKHYFKLRILSCLIVLTNFGFQSPTLAVVFLIQSCSLLRWRGGQAHVTDP